MFILYKRVSCSGVILLFYFVPPPTQDSSLLRKPGISPPTPGGACYRLTKTNENSKGSHNKLMRMALCAYVCMCQSSKPIKTCAGMCKGHSYV